MQATAVNTPKKRRWGPFLLYFMLPSLVSKMIYPSRDAALMWDLILVAYGAALVVWAERFPYLRDLPSVKGWKIWGGIVLIGNTALIGYLLTPSPPSGPWQQFAKWSDGTGLESQLFIDPETVETNNDGRRTAWVKMEYNSTYQATSGTYIRSIVLKVLVDCQQQSVGTLYEDDFTNEGLRGAVTHSVQNKPEEAQMRVMNNETFYLWNQNICQRT